MARLTAVNSVVRGIGILTGPLLARALGASGRGTLAAIVVPFTLAPQIMGLGLPPFVMREAARGTPLGVLVGSIGGLSLVLGGAGALLALVVVPLLAQDRDVVQTYLLIGLFLLPIALLIYLLEALAQGLERWSLFMASRLIPPALLLSGTVTLYVLGELTVASGAIVAIASVLAAILPLLPLLPRSRPLRFRAHVVRDGVAFGVKSWVGLMSALGNSRLDQLLMITFVSARQLGLYVVAFSLSQFPTVLTGAVSSAVMPRVARGEGHMAPRTLRTLLALLIPLAGALALATPVLLPLLFGGDFDDAVPMAWILLAALVPGQAAWVLGTALIGAGRPGTQAAGSSLGLVVTVVGLLILLPRLAAIGAAIVALASALTVFVFLLFQARAHFGGSLKDYLLVTRADIVWARDLVRARLSGSRP